MLLFSPRYQSAAGKRVRQRCRPGAINRWITHKYSHYFKRMHEVIIYKYEHGHVEQCTLWSPIRTHTSHGAVFVERAVATLHINECRAQRMKRKKDNRCPCTAHWMARRPWTPLPAHHYCILHNIHISTCVVRVRYQSNSMCFFYFRQCLMDIGHAEKSGDQNDYWRRKGKKT